MAETCRMTIMFIIKVIRLHLCTCFGSVTVSNCSKHGRGLFKTEEFLRLFDRASL